MELTLDQALQKGIEAHRAGKAQEADRYYTAIIKARPKHPDANHNMGVLAVGVGKVETALPFFKKAIEANPKIEQFWLSYIDTLIKLDRMAEAKAVFDQAKNKGAKGDAFTQIEKQLNVTGKNSQKPKILNSIKLGQALKLAKKKVKRGSYDEAKSIYMDILEKFPKNKTANEGLKKLTSTVKKIASNSQNLPKDKLESLLNLYTQGNLKQTLDTTSSLLKEYPNSIELYNIQGAAYGGLGLLDEAIKSYRNALIIKPDFSEAMYNIGIILQKQFKVAEAINAYKKALSIRPDYAEAYNNIGVTLKDSGKLDEAIKAYKKAVEINNEFSEPFNNLAVVYKMQGKLEEAIDAYGEAIKIDPENASAHRNLSTIKKYKKIDRHVKQVEDLYKNSNLSADKKCKLSFALAKMYEDIGNLERAFDYLSAGNALRKKLLKYSINQDKQLFIRLKEIQPALAKNALKIENEINSVIPVFIVGMPRSGTTLIEQILSSHSKVLGAGELVYLSQFGKTLATVFNSQSKEALLKLRRCYLGEIKKLSDGHKLITDKNPLNFRLIPLICAALPEAKIIHITRDASAICWSNFKHYFPINGLGYCYDLKDVTTYYNLYTELMQTWQFKYENKIYNLNYEKITTNQLDETRRVIKYLGLEWEEACLHPNENTRYVDTASQLQVKQKVYTGSSSAWKKYEPLLDGALDCLANL